MPKLYFLGTFKLKKKKLQEEAFDLSRCKGDPIYFLSPAEKRYLPLTEEFLEEIESGKIRL